MPGNDVGDRIHNFFGQENLSRGQHHPEVAEGSWQGLGNNQWVGGQRQIGSPFISNFKHQSVQQTADSERAHGGQSSGIQHGANFSPSILRPEFSRSQAQNQQQLLLNGYMHGNQIFQTRQNETNFLGVDSESDRRNLLSRGFSVPDAQIGSGPELQKKNSLRMDFNESPVNYDFLGGQQQMVSQHPGLFQHAPRQQSGVNDMQLLQQQAFFKQTQEIQRHQQQQQLLQHQNQHLQQQEGRQLNSVNQVSSIAKQTASSFPSSLVNGFSMHDTSSYPWQPEPVAANTSWPQRGMPQAIQGSTALMLSHEQVQTPRLMGMIPQQVDQSLYGVPISGTRITSGQFSPAQMDKSTLQHISGSSNSFQGNQYTGFSDQGSIQDSTLVSRQGYQGKNLPGTSDTQGLNVGFNMESLQQVDLRQSNGPGQDFLGRQELVGPSETSQDKTVTHVASQNVATLDPTEEKILFGSDENLWEAFGRGANMGSASNNILESADLFGGFPSLQSGSWSALMQSAVAETSSADMGVQEEWSGLAHRSSEPHAQNQSAPTVTDSSKQQSNWADNRMPVGCSTNARPYNLSDGSHGGFSYDHATVVKQSGFGSSHEHSDVPHASPQRFIQPFSGEGAKWLDRKLLQAPVSEGSHDNEKVAHFSAAEPAAKSDSGPLINQQGVASYNTGDQSSRMNGWKSADSVLPSTGATLKGNENSLQASQGNEHGTPMFDATGYGVSMCRTGSGSNSFLDRAKSTTGSPQVIRENSNINKVAALSDSCKVGTNHESGQRLPNGNNIDIWKHVDSSINSRGQEFPGKFESRMDKSHLTFESPGNSSLGNGADNSHEYPDSKDAKYDNSPEVPYHASTSGGRENAWLDVNELSGGKQKSSGLNSRKPVGVRKFQYHPMGDVDVDVDSSYGMKHVTNSQPMPTQVSQGLKGTDYGSVGQSKFPAEMSRNSMEIEKGQFPGFQGETKGSDEITLKNRLSGSAPTGFDRAFHNHVSSNAMASSQNMLELLHKVDQSREHGNVAQFKSSDCNKLREIHEVKSPAGPVHYQQNQSSISQGFGLQLGPPSQLLPVQDRTISSQNPSRKINSLNSTHVSSEVGEKGRTWLTSTSSLQAVPPSHETSQGESQINVSGTAAHTSKISQENFPGGFSYSKSYPQKQQMNDMSEYATHSQPVNDRFGTQSKQMNESFERSKSGQLGLASMQDMSRRSLQNNVASSGEMAQLNNNNQSDTNDSSQQFPILESVSAHQGPLTSQGNASAKMSPAMWTHVSSQQRSFGSQPFKVAPNMFKSNLQPSNDPETTSSVLQKLGQNAQMIGNGPSDSVNSANLLNLVEKELPVKGEESQQVSPVNPAQKTVTAANTSDHNNTQRQIEAFGRSLRPNNILQQDYSLMHQVQGINNADVDPNNRSLKRFKGADDVGDAQQAVPLGRQQFYGQNDMVREGTTSSSSITPGDSKMLNFSAKSADVRDTNLSSQDMLAFTRNSSQSSASCSAVSVRAEHSQINPQMAPSWFHQYGTFKNGQILPSLDAHKPGAIRTMELPFAPGRTSNSLDAHGPLQQGNAIAADASQHGLLQKGSTLSVASENPPPQFISADAAAVDLAVLRPKKRKSPSSELVPWHKQVIHGIQMLNISLAELEWARAANRLTEKVEDEVETVEDVPPAFRSKRRLTLTTQLMQPLFRPPLASVLAADAISHHESILHFLTRSTLGDACSSLCHAGSDNPLSSSSGDLVAEKTSERIRDQYFSKVAADLISRARILEDDLLRLDKRASVLDLRVECQELEKYSVINRFAKFHGRGQADGAETSSQSDASTNSQRFFLQRYVTALPMPRNVPDGVQCFSL